MGFHIKTQHNLISKRNKMESVSMNSASTELLFPSSLTTKFIIELFIDILDLLGFKLHRRNKKKSFSMSLCMSVHEIS